MGSLLGQFRKPPFSKAEGGKGRREGEAGGRARGRSTLKNSLVESGEMAQWGRVLNVQTKDLDLNPLNLYKSQARLCVLKFQGCGEKETERPWDLNDPV